MRNNSIKEKIINSKFYKNTKLFPVVVQIMFDGVVDEAAGGLFIIRRGPFHFFIHASRHSKKNEPSFRNNIFLDDRRAFDDFQLAKDERDRRPEQERQSSVNGRADEKYKKDIPLLRNDFSVLFVEINKGKIHSGLPRLI